MEKEWAVTEDEYGVYKTRTNSLGIIEKLTKYKQKWYDENPQNEVGPQPPSETELLTDYVVDVDYRVTLIEIGI